jgi:hypothetical protein
MGNAIVLRVHALWNFSDEVIVVFMMFDITYFVGIHDCYDICLYTDRW